MSNPSNYTEAMLEIERLRAEVERSGYDSAHYRAEIDALRADRDRLRAALERIADLTPSLGGTIHGPTKDDYSRSFMQAQGIASAALAGGAEAKYPHADEPLMWFDRDRDAVPASEAPVTLELRGRIDPEAPDMIATEVHEVGPRLPCDVRVGAVVFRKGVAVRVLQGKLERDADTLARRDREVARLLTEVDVLRAALTPFASIEAEDGDVFDGYPDECVIRCEVTAGEVRAARDALGASFQQETNHGK